MIPKTITSLEHWTQFITQLQLDSQTAE